MNREDIIRMARETYGPHEFSEAGLIHLGHFAALVAAAEREACAQFIETGYVRQFENPWRDDLSAAIRAIDPLTRYTLDNLTCSAAAAELRRLHEENAALRREVAALSANALDDYRKIERLEAAQSEQEPVAWVGPRHDARLTLIPRYSGQVFERDQPLYARPQPAAWVTLTDEEAEELRIAEEFDQWGITEGAFKYATRAIEAKLREKNGGQM